MYLYGASGHAKVIIDILQALNVKVSGLFDDNPDLKTLFGLPVYGQFSTTILKQEELILSIGRNSVRKSIADSLPDKINYGKAIAANSLVSPHAQISEGTVVMQGAIIQAGSSVGKHNIINTHASVDHDCFLEDFVHISPHACLCGGVLVGEGTHIGAGAVVIPGVRIGKWCTIGAGAIVIHDLPDAVTVVGNPAKIIK